MCKHLYLWLLSINNFLTNSRPNLPSVILLPNAVCLFVYGFSLYLLIAAHSYTPVQCLVPLIVLLIWIVYYFIQTNESGYIYTSALLQPFVGVDKGYTILVRMIIAGDFLYLECSCLCLYSYLNLPLTFFGSFPLSN